MTIYFLIAKIIIIKIYWIYSSNVLWLWYLRYNKTDLILVLTMFHREQKYTGIVTIPSVYVFFGNKNILSRTKIYRSKPENNLMLQKNNKLVWTWVNRQLWHRTKLPFVLWLPTKITVSHNVPLGYLAPTKIHCLLK